MTYDPTIPRLEAELKAAIKVAQAAQRKLSAARDRADLPDPQSLYVSSEVDEIYKANHAELLAIIPSIVDSARGVKGPYAHLAAAAAKAADPKYYAETRAQIAQIEMLSMADEIVRAAEHGQRPTRATAEAFERASAIARGRLVELPTDETARAIIRAGAKRRGEE
jgi:hypothetical protein